MYKHARARTHTHTHTYTQAWKVFEQKCLDARHCFHHARTHEQTKHKSPPRAPPPQGNQDSLSLSDTHLFARGSMVSPIGFVVQGSWSLDHEPRDRGPPMVSPLPLSRRRPRSSGGGEEGGGGGEMKITSAQRVQNANHEIQTAQTERDARR
jgi:hypothetical protein